MRRGFLAAAVLMVAATGSVLAAETEHEYGYKPDSFEIKYYLQPRFEAELKGESPVEDTFRIRRSRVSLTSKVSPGIKGRLQVSLTPDKNELLDVWFEWTAPRKHRALKAKVGQFKKPFGYQEFVMSSSNLNMIDRTVANSFLEKNLYAAAYDQGAMVSADLREHDIPVQLHAGVFNGNGEGKKSDDNSGKQIVVRGDATPVTGLSIGGNFSANRVDKGMESSWEGVLGGEAVFQQKGLQIVSEVFSGDNYADLLDDPEADVPTFLAAYAELIYRVQGWEPGGRVEVFDPDTDTDADGKTVITGQIGRMFSPNFRWQLNVVHTEYQAGGIEATTSLVTQWTARL